MIAAIATLIAVIAMFLLAVTICLVLPTAIIGTAIYFAAPVVGLKVTFLGACGLGLVIALIANLFRSA